ncbi:hypothetical protein [Paenibacillus sp. MMS18-CY102]|uniref:hypothetical protein n=1 Tax=Paenibacillus sp. MMS18-CY102 TaxID=2682849 RepID=UPI00136533A4|nr:hypothetical protein [Paenibacillus sp. MMS18-CY102]MWC30418.1 hypothetical protein [Paenibacillus sp. MMS18-CY102]
MKSYVAPRMLMHQSVEFGTTNISNSWFYKWCECWDFKPLICWIFHKPGHGGGPRGPSGPSFPGYGGGPGGGGHGH